VKRATAAPILSAIVLALTSANAAANRTELVSVGPGGANATGAGFLAASKDGTKVLFSTVDPLVPEDADGTCFKGYDYYYNEIYGPCTDLYLRDLQAGTTTLVSTGPTGGTGHFDVEQDALMSQDGTRVFFATSERLTSDDTDTYADVYERDVGTGTTKRVSTGPTGGQGPFDARVARVTPDGSRIFFTTSERLTSNDPDDSRDAYLRLNGNTILVSTGPVAGNSSGGAQYPSTLDAGVGPISEDGKLALFGSRQQQTADDTDDCSAAIVPGPCTDIYERDITFATTKLLTTGPTATNGAYNILFGGTTPDLSHVYFSTAEPLTADDTDTGCPFHDGLGEVECIDVFERFNDQTRLISTGPRNTNSREDALFAGVTPDASHVFFTTKEQLVDADNDSAVDVYDRSGNTTTLISGSATVPAADQGAAFAGSSPDGGRVVIGSSDRLSPADTDTYFDWFARRPDGTFELLSIGPTGGNGPYHAHAGLVNEDATRFFFLTDEKLVAADPDQTQDIYERFNGTTTLISRGSTGASARRADVVYAPNRGGIADGGRRLFFYADGQLEPQDTDNTSDIYASIEDPNEPPLCDTVAPSETRLWPANGKLRQVDLSGATDPEGSAVSLRVIGVTQDEPVGRTADATGPPQSATVRLRAERDPKGDGRVYRIAFEASDADGATCRGTATVGVPRKHNQPAVDSAPPSYDSFGR
jgi:hypothetical protein